MGTATTTTTTTTTTTNTNASFSPSSVNCAGNPLSTNTCGAIASDNCVTLSSPNSTSIGTVQVTGNGNAVPGMISGGINGNGSGTVTSSDFALPDMLDLRVASHSLTSIHPPPSRFRTSPIPGHPGIAPPLSSLSPVQSLMTCPDARPARDGDLSKPINALGPLCFAGFYLVTLTRTLVRNRMVPHAVRAAFIAPQLHFGFTVRDRRDNKWRHVHTVQIPYDGLTTAGDWLRLKLGVTQAHYTFKHIKDALQKAVTDAWGNSRWDSLVDTLVEHFDDVADEDITGALKSDAISSRASGTPPAFFALTNCHKGAPDIRRDVDGAISARESLKTVLAHLGLNPSGCNISIAKFRDEVFPLWKRHCPYVREHESADCCRFYDGGYFKKIMIHKHLYNVNGCTSSYHVKDLFEGLDEVIKVWSNPTGMCVREAKCAAGLRYNVDKSFQSGIRSYSKAKFLEAAPHTANEFANFERQLHERVQRLLRFKMKKYPKCRLALRHIEESSDAITHRQPPDVLRPDTPDSPGTPCSPCSPGSRKRKRLERDLMVLPSTPREQKRKHAHLSLKRKEAAEQQVKQYLELLRSDCQRQQCLYEAVKRHGDDCTCNGSGLHTDIELQARYSAPTTCANAPVV